MKTSFDKGKGQWAISWPGRVSRHDLVYLSPPDDPMQGIPLGNGDLGALCWTECSKLIIALNKCDLWEDGKEGPQDNVLGETQMSALRHGGALTIDFNSPIFDVLYIDRCDGRLGLSDAMMKLAVKTPFGTVRIIGRVDLHTGVFCLEIQKNFKENAPVDMQLERFGSRHLPYWYSQISTNTSIGLGGTTSNADAKMMSLSHKLTNGTFCLGASVRGSKTNYSRVNGNRCLARVAGSKFTVLASITSPLKRNSLQQCRKNLEDFDKSSIAKHKAGWKEFWNRSFMESGDDYNDNMWHMAMYYSRSSQGGKYPGRFVDGLWSHYHDFHAWGYYFHWNQQQLYWPLDAAGHHDLTKAYLEYRFAGLENAKKDGTDKFNSDGAFVADVSDHRGYNVTGIYHNHTPVVQIAMDFWRHYEYTQDERFLKTRVLPYMLEAAKFFETCFAKHSDGKYHPRPASAYEGWQLIKDVTTDIAMARSFFKTLLSAMEKAGVRDDRQEKWRDILENLCDYVMLDMGKEYFNNGKYVMGRFTDDKISCKRIIATGTDAESGKIVVSRWPAAKPQKSGKDNVHDALCKLEKCIPPDLATEWDTDGDDGTFPWSELAMVFPHGHLGIKDKNSDLYKAAVTTAKNYSIDGTGWSPVPIILARLGLARELSAVLKDFAYRWQISTNGWVHWGVRTNMKPETALRFRSGKLINVDIPLKERQKDENKLEWPGWNFRHTCLEALYVLSCAMNESLLQSWDGVIRIAPAVSQKQSAKFTLHAAGGFKVSAEINNGKIRWVSIKSDTSNTAVIQNPWKKALICDKDKKLDTTTDRIISLEMKKNQRIVLVEKLQDLKSWAVEKVTYEPNTAIKKTFNGLGQLGLGRCFK